MLYTTSNLISAVQSNCRIRHLLKCAPSV